MKRKSILLSVLSCLALSLPAPALAAGAGAKFVDAQAVFAALDAQDRSEDTLLKLEDMARKGHLEAQFRMGLVFAERGAHPQALIWFRRAARQGDANARLYVLTGYRKGISPMDGEKKQYDPPGADSGDPEDLLDKGLHYQYGRLLPKDEKRAVALFEQAVAKGSGHGMTLLGRIHEQSQDPAIRNPDLALKWYRRGMEANEPLAMHNLSAMLDESEDTRDQGLPYLQRAADLGFAASLSDLGRKLKHGAGVAKDPGKAEALFLRAGSLGYTPARYELALMLKARWEAENTRLKSEFQASWDQAAQRIQDGENADKAKAEFRTYHLEHRTKESHNDVVLGQLVRAAAGACYDGDSSAAILALADAASVDAFKALPTLQKEGTADCLLGACLKRGEDAACKPAVLSSASINAVPACLHAALREFEHGLKGGLEDWRYCLEPLPAMTEGDYVSYVQNKKALAWDSLIHMPRELVAREILLKMTAALPDKASVNRQILDQSLATVDEKISRLDPAFKAAKEAQYKALMTRAQYFRSEWKPPSPGCGSRPAVASLRASESEVDRSLARSREFVDCARRWLDEVKQGNVREIVGEEIWRDMGNSVYSLDEEDVKRMGAALKAIDASLRQEVDALNAEWKARNDRLDARNAEVERANLRRELEATLRANQRVLDNASRPSVPGRPMFVLPGMN